ncbi:uncharacterized protein LOC143594219 [Bidens hawaiensis]|uniref:uncharacterized protein LOC143594219 n=1 Tax=Bidens hawaiensis TaxID=980011 RepID=UPI00404A098B
MELAGYLMDKMIRNRDEKRKYDGRQTVGGKAKKVEKKREGTFMYNRPICKSCGMRHFDKCLRPLNTITCNFCKKTGHVEADCKRKAAVCFDCGEKRHFSTECPKRKPTTATAGASGSGSKTDVKKGSARVFMLDTQKATNIPDVITDTFPINIFMLEFYLTQHYEIETADGNLSRITEALDNATISLADHIIPLRLLPMKVAGFDVVLGMDWLSSNQARILCNDKAIGIRTSNNKTIRITDDKEARKVGIVSKIKVNRCLGKGCLTFMACATKEPESKKIEEMPVVSEFKDVFPD